MNVRNFCFFKGRLVRDPDLKTANNGNPYCNITIAVDRGYGESKATDFFDCVAFRNTATFIANNFTKGRAIMLCGELQTSKYTDKNGNNRTSYKIAIDGADFADSKNAQTAGGFDSLAETVKNNFGEDAVVNSAPAMEEIEDPDGDVPF